MADRKIIADSNTGIIYKMKSNQEGVLVPQKCSQI